MVHIKKSFKVDISACLVDMMLKSTFSGHIPKLKPALNQLILSASANALKVSQRNPDFFESFVDKHKNCNRATPNKMIIYKHLKKKRNFQLIQIKEN